MQFETLIHAKTPRVRCTDDKVKVVELPWAEKGSRFTLLFEAFAIKVLKAARSVKDTRELLRLSWFQTHEIMSAAVEGWLASRDGVNSWQEESVRIEGDGEHAVAWTYTMDDVESKGEDAAWVAGYGWALDYVVSAH